jgi:hypothetical protein
MLADVFPDGSTAARVGAAAQGGRRREAGTNGGTHMTELAVRVRQEEHGMTTAEYAVGTCAATGVGGLLISILTSETVRNLLLQVIQKAFSFLF